MKHYAGIDLSMETTHVCILDADGRKVGAECVESTPATIAAALERQSGRTSGDRDGPDGSA